LLVNKPIHAVTEGKFRASGGYQSNQGAGEKFIEMITLLKIGAYGQ
jgi:hypothetical protein